jgi:predicted site-specific integrase-resolvase
MDIHQLHRIGYTRVSSIGQNLDSQIAALKAAGCKKISTDKMTGSRMDRPGWDQLMEYVSFGDILVVAELRRMTRFLMHLLKTVQELDRKEGQPRLSTRKHRYQHRRRTVLHFDDGRNPSDGTGASSPTSLN